MTTELGAGAAEGAVHTWVAEQAAASPGAIAVRTASRGVTYEWLTGAAARVAGWLQARGVGPGSRVGVCAHRDVDLIVALLGVLNAGAAYVPLDAEYPVEALRFVVRDAGIALILTSGAAADAVAAALRVPAVQVARAQAEGARVPARRVPSAAPAYVIYTSGSTGRPKGTLVAHGGVANYIAWVMKDGIGGRVGPAPLHTGITFDMAVTTLFGPLVTGGTVVLMPEGAGLTPLQDVVRSPEAWTFVKVTPSHLTALGEWLRPERVRATIGALIVGGEALTGEMLAPWRRCFPRMRVINEYGPTETVVGSIAYEVPGAQTTGPVPIGRPIAGTSIAVVDAAGRPVADGEVGELIIGGAGVAHGYIGRPGLTASRFVADMTGARAGARCYRTGDRVRMLATGNLEYLGRVDHQVKLRGYRIELLEIDAVVRAAPGVLDAVAVVESPDTAAASLVAYARVPAAGAPTSATLTAAAVTEYLRERLPAHMLPAVRLVEEWPLTPSGKVDRAAFAGIVGTRPLAPQSTV